MYLINISLTFLLINRWLISGHLPLSNLYESLIFLSWSFSTIYSITSFTLRGEAKAILLPIIRWSVAPITLITCAYAFFCVPQELQKAESLVPALQSNWLIMHVSVMILSYASLILGSLFAFSLLLILQFELLYPYKFAFLKQFARTLRTPSVVSVNEGSNFASLPQVDASTGTTFGRTATSGEYTRSATLTWTEGTRSVSEDSTHQPSAQSTLNFLLWNQRFIGAGKATHRPAVASLSQATSMNRGFIETSNKQNFIKNNNFLDNLSYRFIGLGFALLTLGIISGAVWANSAWGSYWSWDPKETWAFITWLTYAIYLHLRISKGWYGKQSAFVALFGFFVVWFCYLGVNLFGKGLHSYAFV